MSGIVTILPSFWVWVACKMWGFKSWVSWNVVRVCTYLGVKGMNTFVRKCSDRLWVTRTPTTFYRQLFKIRIAFPASIFFSFPFPLPQNPSPSKPTSPRQDFSLVLFIISRMVRPIYSVKPWDLDFNTASVPANVRLLGTNYFSAVIHLCHTHVIPVPRSEFLFSLQRNGNRLSKFSCTHFRLWDS